MLAAKEGNMRSVMKKLAGMAGYEVRNADPQRLTDPDDIDTVNFVRPYTQVSVERLTAVIDATRYVCRVDVPGAIVECGVWRGGCMMAIARTLLKVGAMRDLYLFDTFEGMPQPSTVDKDANGAHAKIYFTNNTPGERWNEVRLEEVRENMAKTGYPPEKVHYVKGMVEDTVPASSPQSISLLRLDTDFYESTKHELQHLYPRLSPKGVLIIDDYGAWAGAKKAVDEFIAATNAPLLLNRTDYTGRMAIKP
jgi:O-methyltransferase